MLYPLRLYIRISPFIVLVRRYLYNTYIRYVPDFGWISFFSSRSCGTVLESFLILSRSSCFFISPFFPFFLFFFTLLKTALQVATLHSCVAVQVYTFSPPVLCRLFVDYLSLLPGPAGKLFALGRWKRR